MDVVRKEYELSLNQSVSQLYKVFESYPLKPKIKGCPCCISDAGELKFHSKSLNELTENDLLPFIYASQSTVGDLEDFKHFLPRILELIVKGKGLPNVIMSYIKKNYYAQFIEWPLLEQEAIVNFLQSWWDYELSADHDEYLPSSELRDCIEAINKLDDDCVKFLEFGLMNKSAYAICHIIDLLGDDIFRATIWNDKQIHLIFLWLQKKETMDILKNHSYFQYNGWKLSSWKLPGYDWK